MKKILSVMLVFVMASIVIIAWGNGNAHAATLYKKNVKYGNVTYSTETYNTSYVYDKSAKRSYVTTATKWNWSEQPQLFTDIVAVANNKGFSVNQYCKAKDNTCILEDEAVCEVTYCLCKGQSADNSSAYKPRKMKITVKTKDLGAGAYAQIPMCKTIKINGINTRWYAKSGTLIVKWSKSGSATANITDLMISSLYGHAKVKMTPQVGISNGKITVGGTLAKNLSYGSEARITLSGKPMPGKPVKISGVANGGGGGGSR